ncbi:type II secretion system protein [Lactimicrobium massiliense]|uniref:type II secretion system protein n=1 Tax=Lactimicrobium massiliense TaxID=2161814 RepID=UPI0014355719|nr:type II secretion system protein [Lactimicrobium massiliense]
MNKKRYTGNKGFTLGEMLITVAIVTILVAVTIVNVVPYVWNLRLKDADQAAHEIYLAAQYHLSSASSTGALNVYNTSQLGTEDNLYTGTNYQASSGDHVYDIVVSPDQKKPAILDAVLPYGSVDETLRSSGSYIITYDYDSATVLGVFFSYANKSYGYLFSITDLSDKADALHKAMASDNGNISSEGAKTIRRHFPDGSAKHTIGFYGGEDTGASAKVSDAPILYVDNGDTLDALISLNKEQVKPGYYLQLRVYGTDSQKTEVKNLQLSDLTKKDDSYVYTLDAFQDKTGGDSLQFAKQFDKLYAGENITVTARIVKSTNNTYTNVSKFSDPVHTNSLFGSLNNGKAIISSIRHLENLGKFNDYVKVTSASQVSDITFSNYIVNLENRVGIKTDNVKYEPVNLKQSLIYDGSYTYTDSDNSKTARQHLLSGTVTETDKDGGVFGTLTGSTSALKVTGLEVMDINVKADGHAGALLGQASDGATFETDNVLVWSKSADLSIQSTGGDAGGLIGRGSGNVTINNSAASIYVKGSGNAGGLAGYASNLTVDKSYASGHTYQSKYIDRTDISDENGNQRYNIIAGNGYAGGLAGSVNHIQKISSSYTTASVHSGTEANSAAFVGNNSNFIGDGSYAVTSLNGKAVKEPSDFTGNAGTKTKYVNDETLLGTESAVTYPYSTISELAGSNLDNATWFLSAHVGDWTAETQSKAETSFNNKEILQFITTVPDVSADDEIEVQFFYGNTYKDQYGNTQRMGVYGMSDLSQTPALTFTFKNGKIYSINNYYNYANLKTWNTKTPDDWRSNLCKIKPEGNQTTFTINLDDITYYKNGNLGSFANVLSNVLGIAPGYDVTARVVENGTVISDPVVTNSLYGDQTTADTIVVSCGRHLQNLDPSVSNNKWTDANISKINLTSDIAWNSTSDSFFDRVNNLRINPSDTVDGVYAGSQIVSNKKFLSINGYNFNNSNNAVVFEGNGHTISDINFHVNDDASGLFSKIHDFTVQDLTILNGQIEAENNVQAAGLLAGYYSNGSVKNCYAVGENSAVRIGNSQYAGGLVGYMQSTDMTNCGASVYVQGSIAGGLVGDFNSGSISRSFSGGRTTNGSYLENAKVKGYYNVEGYTDAGGLVGQSGGTITHCYSTSSVYSGNNQSILPHWGYTSGNGHAGGLIGKTGNQKAVNNSYAVGMVLGPQGSAGALIGYYDNYGFDDSVVNNYYLEGINVDVSTMKELPAVGGPNQTVYINGQTQSLTEGHMSCVNYYSSDSNPIARADDSKVHYFTYSYDSTLQGSYPYVSWTRQADNVSTHYGGWQIPINKPTLCHILLLDSDGTTKVAETSVSYGTDWASQFEQYSAQLSSKKVDGKSFVGWVDSNGNPVTESSFASVITDITATAKYASEVSFYYEDPETGNNEFISTAVVKDSDMSVNVPSYPSFNGYSFEGWFIDNNNTAVVKNNKIYNPSASKYTAKYKKQVIYTYKVLFCYEEKNGTPGNRITSLNTHTYERTNDNYQSFNQEISLMGITAPYGQLDKLYAVNDDTGDKILDQPLHSADNKVTITGYAADVTYYVLFISKQVTYNVEHIFKNSSDLYKQAKVENGLLQNGDELAYDPYSQVTLTETKPGNAGSMTAATIIENLGDG